MLQTNKPMLPKKHNRLGRDNKPTLVIIQETLFPLGTIWFEHIFVSFYMKRDWVEHRCYVEDLEFPPGDYFK